MIEVKLVNVSFSIAPMPEGGKQIAFIHHPTQTVYLAPFGEEGLENLINDLSLSNEELERKIEQQRLAKELEVSKEEKAALGGIEGLLVPGKDGNL